MVSFHYAVTILITIMQYFDNKRKMENHLNKLLSGEQ